MPYQGYDPSKYMKDFSWIGDIGNTIAQFAYKMPELINLNRSIAENTNNNRDIYKGINQFIDTIVSHPKLFSEVSKNYGVDDPKELEELLKNKFRAPKEREDNGKYTKETITAMSEVLRENSSIEPSLFAMLSTYAEEGAVTPDIYAAHDKSKNIHEYNAFFDKLKKGKSVVSDLGNETTEPYDIDTIQQMVTQSSIPHVLQSDPIYKQYIDDGMKAKDLKTINKVLDDIGGKLNNMSQSEISQAMIKEGIAESSINSFLMPLHRDRSLSLELERINQRPIPKETLNKISDIDETRKFISEVDKEIKRIEEIGKKDRSSDQELYLLNLKESYKLLLETHKVLSSSGGKVTAEEAKVSAKGVREEKRPFEEVVNKFSDYKKWYKTSGAEQKDYKEDIESTGEYKILGWENDDTPIIMRVSDGVIYKSGDILGTTKQSTQKTAESPEKTQAYQVVEEIQRVFSDRDIGKITDQEIITQFGMSLQELEDKLNFAQSIIDRP